MSRRDLENETYSEWLKSTGDEADALFIDLRNLLVNHSQAVIFLVMRTADPELAAKAADQVLLNLDSYKGDCLFTTWAHKIILTTVYDERRVLRRRKETSMDVAGFDLPGDPTIGMSDVLIFLDETLTVPDDRKLFDALVFEGLTHQEIADESGVERSTISHRWLLIQRRLKDAFGQSVPHRG